MANGVRVGLRIQAAIDGLQQVRALVDGLDDLGTEGQQTAGQAIRINGTEATVSSIFTPGVPGVLVISPHIGVSGGEMIEVFV